MYLREKLAITTTCFYILLMAIGMLTLSTLGISYTSPTMVTVLIYFEIVLTLLSFIIYKKLNLNIFKTKINLSKWFWPFIAVIILCLVSLLFTSNTYENFRLVILILMTTALVGFSEELMFRGVLLKVLLEKRNIKLAIFFSSFAFSLLHSVNYLGGLSLIGTLGQVLVTFITGVIFSCLFLLMNNIIPLIVYHFIWDFVSIAGNVMNANVNWVFSIGFVIQVIIIIPLLLHTIKTQKFNVMHE
ncbi:TPA: CPBP family intramembrane metalloprotease [Staphylococcus aureus]|nr:CPBP family intramembrane metalloprotease [Staphylococcus aureus]